MRETKIYCDICGKEVGDHYSLTINFERQNYSTELERGFNDVCQNCIEKIDNTIDGLKK